jgi:hypothetical protein
MGSDNNEKKATAVVMNPARTWPAARAAGARSCPAHFAMTSEDSLAPASRGKKKKKKKKEKKKKKKKKKTKKKKKKKKKKS